jgi:predicted helicase
VWSSGVKTRRDNFMVAFSEQELVQRLELFSGKLSKEEVSKSLKITDTKYWNIEKAREAVRKIDYKAKIIPYVYRPFDSRFVFYYPKIIERGDARDSLMKHLLSENLAIATTRKLAASSDFRHIFVSSEVTDMGYISNRTSESCYFFPLYLYPDERREKLLDEKASNKPERTSNFTAEFLQAIKEALGTEEDPMAEEIFYYIYAVLYSPSYRKRYEELPNRCVSGDGEVFEG